MKPPLGRGTDYDIDVAGELSSPRSSQSVERYISKKVE
jgi:hypothetical protein